MRQPLSTHPDFLKNKQFVADATSAELLRVR